MKCAHKFVLVALALGTFALYYLYNHYFADKIAVNRLLVHGVGAVEGEDLPKIENILSVNCADRESMLTAAQKYFREFEPMRIRIARKLSEIDGNSAKIALLVLISSTFEGMGEVTGRETVGLELKREKGNGYHGWRITRVSFQGRS